MTVVLLAAIAVGVWVMAAESVVFAVVRARKASRARRDRLRIAEALRQQALLDEARARQDAP